jgi:hypothetical protein
MSESVFVDGVGSATQITKSSHRRHLFVPSKKKKKTQREGKRFFVACRCYLSRLLLKPSAMIPTTIPRRAAFETFYLRDSLSPRESCFMKRRKETQRQQRPSRSSEEQNEKHRAIKLLFCIHFNFKISIYVFSSTATSIFRERWNVPIHTTELLLLSPLSFFLSFPSLERNRTSSSLSLSLHLNLL